MEPLIAGTSSPATDNGADRFLQLAPPEYLTTIRSGFALVLNGILLSIILGFAGVLIGVSGGATGANLATFTTITSLLAAVPAVMLLAGYWRLTQPDARFVGREDPKSARTLVRATAGVQAMLQLISIALSIRLSLPAFRGGGASPFTLVTLLIGLAGIALWALQFVAVMLYTQWIASRIPDALALKRAERYVWLLPLLQTVGLLILIGPLFALVMYWNLLNRIRTHLKSITQTGEPAKLVGAESSIG